MTDNIYLKDDYSYFEEAKQQLLEFYKFILESLIKRKVFILKNPERLLQIMINFAKPYHFIVGGVDREEYYEWSAFFPTSQRGSLKHLLNVLNFAGFAVEELKVAILNFKLRKNEKNEYEAIDVDVIWQDLIRDNKIVKTFDEIIEQYQFFRILTSDELKSISKLEEDFINDSSEIENPRFYLVVSNVFKIILREILGPLTTIWLPCNKIVSDYTTYVKKLIRANTPVEFLFSVFIRFGKDFKDYDAAKLPGLASLKGNYTNFLFNISFYDLEPFNSIQFYKSIDLRNDLRRSNGRVFDPILICGDYFDFNLDFTPYWNLYDLTKLKFIGIKPTNYTLASDYNIRFKFKIYDYSVSKLKSITFNINEIY